jgi:Zn finger protein HypA/HybF involved in hydrogenase expression
VIDHIRAELSAEGGVKQFVPVRHSRYCDKCAGTGKLLVVKRPLNDDCATVHIQDFMEIRCPQCAGKGGE